MNLELLFYEALKEVFKRRVSFMSWQDYSTKIEFIDLFEFQQRTRRENIKNLGA